MARSPRGLILAAGRGSRMGAATTDQPKCRTELHGRSLLDWQLGAMREAGIEDIGVVRGYLAQSFDLPLTYFDNPRWSETNMVMSLMCAAPWLRDGPCIVSYSDIVYKAATVRMLINSTANIAITYDPDWFSLWQFRFEDPLADAESFRIEGDRVMEIGAKSASVSDIEGQFMGLLRFTPAGWSDVEKYVGSLTPAMRDRLDMTGLLRKLIAEDTYVTGIAIKEPWCEVDTVLDLERYRAAPMWNWKHSSDSC